MRVIEDLGERAEAIPCFLRRVCVPEPACGVAKREAGTYRTDCRSSVPALRPAARPPLDGLKGRGSSKDEAR